MNADELNVTGGSAEAAGTTPPRGDEDERVAATIGNWKRKLLDVSKRNRALNFKPNKVTTVTVVRSSEITAKIRPF